MSTTRISATTVWRNSGVNTTFPALPFSLKILLENLLRHEDGVDVTRSDIEALCNWSPGAAPVTEIAFTPSRVVLQDFTGVPAVVDLAAMRDAMTALRRQRRADQPAFSGGTGD